jgi:PIN domain nuclease of toxin-antitoxin system
VGVNGTSSKYLLDTHAFVWLALNTKSVPAHIELAMADPDVRVYVSTVSAYEVGLKVRLGKWDQAARVLMHWERAAGAMRIEQLSLNVEHALQAGALTWDNRDPFDRMLVAQAQVSDLTIVTADRAVLSAPDIQLLRW